MTKSSAEIPRIQRSDVARSELDTSVQSTTVLAQLISQRNVWTFEGIYYMNATPVDPWREASLIQGRTTKDWRSRRETGQGHGKKSAESLWLSLFFRFINIIKKQTTHSVCPLNAANNLDYRFWSIAEPSLLLQDKKANETAIECSSAALNNRWNKTTKTKHCTLISTNPDVRTTRRRRRGRGSAGLGCFALGCKSCKMK